MQIDLHNFFKFYDEKNPNHVKAVQILEDTLPNIFMQDDSEWVKVYRARVEPPKSNILQNFPWYPQTDNYRDPQRTCNSSACAMCLEYFKPGTLTGPKGDDAYIRKVFAIGDTTDHTVQTRVLQSYGVRSEFRYNLSFDDLDRELSAGRPVVIGILHRGTLSAPTGGHMLCVIGKSLDGKSYICNDPFGSLNTGYTGPVTQGKGVQYSVDVLRRRWTVDGPKSGWGRVFL
jgi:hypothetical protein